MCCLVVFAATHQCICLPDLLRRLLQPPLGRVNLAVTAVDVMLHVSHVVELEAPPALLVCVCVLVLGLERFIVHLGAGTQLVLCVGEEIVRAISNKIRPADLGVGDTELRRALVGAAHELLSHELLFPCVSIQVGCEEHLCIPSSRRVSAAAMMSDIAVPWVRCDSVDVQRLYGKKWRPRQCQVPTLPANHMRRTFTLRNLHALSPAVRHSFREEGAAMLRCSRLFYTCCSMPS